MAGSTVWECELGGGGIFLNLGCILQEVEYVKQEAKLVYLLECLQKTAPPVLIFAEKQTDVDDVHEYLMSKDVDAVAVHGQKTQEERAEAIDQFKVCRAPQLQALDAVNDSVWSARRWTLENPCSDQADGLNPPGPGLQCFGHLRCAAAFLSRSEATSRGGGGGGAPWDERLQWRASLLWQCIQMTTLMGTQAGKADVLVATDVASKGLDFPDIQHVINFDMPSEIENYVHRIGRTGRCGKTGIATTFINKNQSESILLDLKHLLKEAKQRIPPVLMVSFHLSFVCHCFPDAYNICLTYWGNEDA